MEASARSRGGLVKRWAMGGRLAGWQAGRLVSVGMSTCTALRLIHAEFLLSFGIVFLTRVPMG